MSSLVSCVKYCCTKICNAVGLTQPPKKAYSAALDQGQKLSLRDQFYGEESKQLKHKTKGREPSNNFSNEIVGIDGVIIGDNHKGVAKETVPTKDISILSTTNSSSIDAKLIQTQQPQSYVFNVSSFKVDLQPYENYYEILQSKAKNLHQKLNVNSTPIELQKAPCGLKIRHSQSGKLNILIYKFKLPCSYAFYNEMLNDYALQKSLDNNIDQYKLLQLYSNNFRLNYLSYKKVLIVSPRDFVYLKYSTNQNGQNWDMSFSIPYQNIPYKVRGQIILSCSKIIQKDDQIQIEVYSEVDMKLSVSPKITKNQGVNQIKKYVQKCDKYIKENYKKSLI